MADPPSVGDLLANARRRLASVSETPDLDSQVLLAHTLNKPRPWIYAHPEFKPKSAEIATFEQALQKLEGGQPLPYILGSWEFYGLKFLVTPAVLIPRPETELLIEQALTWLTTHSKRRYAVDVGTGSGCIAISLAVKVPNLRLIASDISFSALKVAKANAALHQVSERIQFMQANLLPPAKISFDLVCANLPYIPSSRLSELEIYGKEPTSALDGGPQGLDWIGKMLAVLPHHVSPGGRMMLEIDVSQRESAAHMAASIFPEAEIRVQLDLAGLERLLVIDLPA